MNRISEKRNEATLALENCFKQHHSGAIIDIEEFVRVIFDGVAEEACGRELTTQPPAAPIQKGSPFTIADSTVFSHLLIILNTLDDKQRKRVLDILVKHCDENDWFGPNLADNCVRFVVR